MINVTDEPRVKPDLNEAMGGEGTAFDTDALRCDRCGGLMVSNHCFDLDNSWGGRWCRALRCIQCGDLIDPVILQNRHRSRGGQQASPVSEPAHRG